MIDKIMDFRRKAIAERKPLCDGFFLCENFFEKIQKSRDEIKKRKIMTHYIIVMFDNAMN
jgi:hypothetical protein